MMTTGFHHDGAPRRPCQSAAAVRLAREGTCLTTTLQLLVVGDDDCDHMGLPVGSVETLCPLPVVTVFRPAAGIYNIGYHSVR